MLFHFITIMVSRWYSNLRLMVKNCLFSSSSHYSKQLPQKFVRFFGLKSYCFTKLGHKKDKACAT